MLEVYMEALAGKTGDPFLEQINMGTGNYNNAEYWQQVQAFRNGMFAESAVSRKILERAQRETKEAIVDAIFDTPESKHLDQVSYPDPGDKDRDEYYNEYADQIWEKLGTESMPPSQHKAILVSEVTNIGLDWTPPHHRMLKFKHEASQSKGARIIDNLFDRVKEFHGNDPEDFNK